MNITPFFQNVLGAKLNNPRQSWGAIDSVNNRVFLRIWEDQRKKVGNIETVQVYWKIHRNNSHGYKERLKQLEAIKNGSKAFGVLCEAADINPIRERRIKKFDEANLFLLGDFSEDDQFIYAEIVGKILVEDLKSVLVTDLKTITENKTTNQTTVQALVNARIGQGKFGAEVMKLWNNACCVTGSLTRAAIAACHIKPWRYSNNCERLDPNNGLPLTANLHALFDAGLISFDEEGKMLISSKLSQTEQAIFSLDGCKLNKTPSPEVVEYMSYHRNEIFQT